MNVKWSRETIAEEILRLHEVGEHLSYSNMAMDHVSLLRASVRHFGSWEAAVTFTGLDYEQIRRYKTWTRERIIARIQELHERGEDLSWRNASEILDPQLTAAATKRKHFGSWRHALECAGLDYDTIRRYREWNGDRIVEGVRDLHASGGRLNAKSMTERNVALITAARRHFESWHETLAASGLDYEKIVLRAPFKRRLANRRRYDPTSMGVSAGG